VKKTILLFAVLSCFTGVAQAQDPGEHGGAPGGHHRGRFGAGVLIGLPVGDLGDLVDLSIGGLVDFDWALQPMLHLTGRAGFIYHLIDIEGFSLSTIPIWPGVKYYFMPAEASTRFFVSGELGVNFNIASVEFGGESDSETDLDLGLNLGGGVELGAISLRAFIAILDLGEAGDTMVLMASASYYFTAF
jgi:hypothetical protein